jgi:hypothetical protein
VKAISFDSRLDGYNRDPRVFAIQGASTQQLQLMGPSSPAHPAMHNKNKIVTNKKKDNTKMDSKNIGNRRDGMQGAKRLAGAGAKTGTGTGTTGASGGARMQNAKKRPTFVKPWDFSVPYLSKNGNKLTAEFEKFFRGFCQKCGRAFKPYCIQLQNLSRKHSYSDPVQHLCTGSA